MGIKFYDSNGKYWGEYDETRNLFIPFKKRTMRDCYNCKRYEAEGECIECHYEPKDEPTISKMEQVEPQTITIEGKMSLNEWRKICPEHPQFKDEPQTDCSWKKGE